MIVGDFYSNGGISFETYNSLKYHPPQGGGDGIKDELRGDAYDIAKALQQPKIQFDDDDSDAEQEEPVRRATIHKLLMDQTKSLNWNNLEVNFKRRFFKEGKYVENWEKLCVEFVYDIEFISCLNYCSCFIDALNIAQADVIFVRVWKPSISILCVAFRRSDFVTLYENYEVSIVQMTYVCASVASKCTHRKPDTEDKTGRGRFHSSNHFINYRLNEKHWVLSTNC